MLMQFAVDDGMLAANGDFEVGFLEGNVEVSTFERGGNGDCQVKVADCLGPGVGEGGLFGGFAGVKGGVGGLLVGGGEFGCVGHSSGGESDGVCGWSVL